MKKIYIKKIKENKGFTTSDIIISVIMIMIFVGIITTLFYNFYLTTSAKNRNAIATNCIIDVIEQTKAMKYDEPTQESVETLIDSLEADKTIPEGYTVTAQLQKYNETENNTDKKDLIKILKVTVKYTVGEKTEKIEISTLLTK